MPYQPNTQGPGKAEFDTHATVHKVRTGPSIKARSDARPHSPRPTISTRDTRKANQAADPRARELLGIRLGQRLGRHAVATSLRRTGPSRQQPTRQLQTETRMAKGWGSTPGQHERAHRPSPSYRHQQGPEIRLAIDLHQRQTAKHVTASTSRISNDESRSIPPSTSAPPRRARPGRRQSPRGINGAPYFMRPGNRIHSDHVPGHYGGNNSSMNHQISLTAS